MKTIEHFVNGKSFSGTSKRTSDVFNPATGEVSAKVNLASKKDVEDAVEIASKAFIKWSQVPPLQRALGGLSPQRLPPQHAELLCQTAQPRCAFGG